MISVNATALVDWLSKLGFGGVITLALVGFQQGWWTFGRETAEVRSQLMAMTKDRDEWKARYLAAVTLGERAAETTAKAAGAVEVLSA